MGFNTQTDVAAAKKGIKFTNFICLLLGNGYVIAWNSMSTIVDYYATLFPRYHPTRVFTLIYISFTFATTAILTYKEANLNTRRRNIFGYTLFLISTVLIIVIDLATSGRAGIGAFLAICMTSAVCGVADAFVQGGMVGDLSFMDPSLMQSFLAGVGMCGAFTSTLRVVTKASFEHTGGGLRKGALMFFTIASVFEFVCVLLYAYVFPKLPIVKFYRLKAAAEGSKTVYADLAAAKSQMIDRPEAGECTTGEEDPQQLSRLTIGQLLMKNLDYCLDLYLIYSITFAIVPGFLTEDTGNHSLGSWYALVLLSMHSVADLIGRYSPLIKYLKIESRKVLMFASISRFLFIPAFYFTAKHGKQGWMMLLSSLIGLTKGHLNVCVLTAAPKGYKGPEANALGNLLVLFLEGGSFSGVSLDWLWLIG